MAWRLDRSVIRGEIDNREKGRVKGRIWLTGCDEPVRLNLTGNCGRDLAGCFMQFENPDPRPGEHVELSPEQKGVVGGMTASRKVRVLDVSVEEAIFLESADKPVPEHMENCLYLEWFSNANGRVVIESTHYIIEISAPEWTLSAGEHAKQVRENGRAIEEWMERLAFMPDGDEEEEDDDDLLWDDDSPMDEFEWEKHLKESDRLTDRYMALLDKYMDHPDREKLVAKEMGWTWLVDALDDDAPKEKEQRPEFDFDDVPPLEPNAYTEGVDWIRSEKGRITHPLTERSFENVMAMWHYCDKQGLMGEGGEEDVRDMVFQAQTLTAKLAGALDSLAYDEIVEGGFVVACLKRALLFLNKSIEASDKVRNAELMEEKKLGEFRKELFAVREEMLKLMQKYRQKRW
ncbi:MAG: hypothetical protein KJ626_09815 [Verrucomicrobia bacterium]|nr:hypothetical protein [Verrucomicrobiota bacterium]